MTLAARSYTATTAPLPARGPPAVAVVARSVPSVIKGG